MNTVEGFGLKTCSGIKAVRAGPGGCWEFM